MGAPQARAEGRNNMSSDTAANAGTVVLVFAILAIVGVGGWIYVQRPNEPDYLAALGPEAQLEYEIERNLALIAIANREKADPWHVSETVSSKDDSKVITVHANAMMPITIRGGPYETPGMTIRCMENVTSVLLSFDSFIGSRNRSVEYRVDEKILQRGTWSASTDSKTVGLWHGAQAIPFIKALLGGESMTVWLVPHNSAGVAVSFNIKNLESHVQKVANACNWSVSNRG